jgi:putative acetyltransferase
MREDRISNATERHPSTALATIRPARSPEDIALTRALFLEYARWLNVDLCFQGFDAELAGLPGAYAPPRGRLLLAATPGTAFGCIALRPLEQESGERDPRVGEVKRLYVQPAHRGARWGHRLAETVIEEARAIGYRELKLDTLGWMAPARALYAALGFRECAAYYDNPLPEVVYMALQLPAAKRVR